MPSTAAETRLILTDEQARQLATQFGTPLYVIDETLLRDKARTYKEAFAAAWPRTSLSYASKANSTLAVLRVVHQEGLHIDVASEGELRAALKAGVPASSTDLHGNNKQRAELEFAIAQGVRHIVVDNFAEIELLAELGNTPSLMLRLAPGVDPKTHAKISTGQADTKFGFNIADGSAEKALLRCLELGLPVKGIHCHVGSQLLDPEAQISGGEFLAEFAIAMRDKHGWEAEEINVGGGLGIRYLDSDHPQDPHTYCRNLVAPLGAKLKEAGMAPTLAQEPGRSIIGEAGVTIYRVGVVKTVPSATKGHRTYVAVDGGLSDNPRPVMYGAKYTVLHIPGDGRTVAESKPVTISGKHCETDMLFEDVMLPADIQPGDYVQVLCTGAYNATMASNYNRYQRPAAVMVRPDGSASLVQRPETWDELLSRDLVPSDL